MSERIFLPVDPDNNKLKAILEIAEIVYKLPYDDVFKLEIFKAILINCLQ